MTQQTDRQKKWAKIVAKSWADESYKEKLLADPASVLKEEGFAIPESTEIKIAEAKENQILLTLPPKPKDDDIEAGEERIAAYFLF